ncbi:putative holin-like toxin [Velocimicrobium porci]|uniref:Putative holin-like toxin n=1 Tax=Velocimicrobium porci TaxID=2606634 RepID=A0A6L5XWK6_9FIRM|nr:putative holin-like toxin [Velocimicrobium porci]DAN97724.1 MAG TPA: Putative Holin-like Toxin (Hol-Tox) [Caudoviricetes sp.]
MTTFEAIYLMLTFGTFVLALLAYIESRNKHK